MRCALDVLIICAIMMMGLSVWVILNDDSGISAWGNNMGAEYRA